LYGYTAYACLQWQGEDADSLEEELPMPVKLTVNLSDEVADALKKMAQENGITVTEQLRRAISTEKWVEDIDKDREKKLIVEDNGQLKEVVFRP
jgi:hypothetical protein